MKFRKVFINSSHRRHGGRPSNFTIELAIDAECPGEAYCSVRNVSLPNVFYSLMNSNNRLYFWQQHETTASLSVNTIITIPEGNYSNSSLTSALQTALNANALGSRTYSCSYNAVSQKITVLCNGGSFSIYDDNTLKNLGLKNPANGGFFDGQSIVQNPRSLQQILNIPPYAAENNQWQSGIVAVNKCLEAFVRSPNLANGTLDSNGMTNTFSARGDR